MLQNSSQNATDANQLLRCELRSKRLELPIDQRQAFDLAICQHVQGLVNIRNPRSIACYLPFNGEPDLTLLYTQLMADGCEMALPVVSAKENGIMKFCVWRANSQLVKNKYGIFEPPEDTGLPLSGFDMLMLRRLNPFISLGELNEILAGQKRTKRFQCG